MGLLGAVFDQLVKQLVQLLLVVVEKLAVGLRRRLAADPSIQLVNVRGVGYKLLMR